MLMDAIARNVRSDVDVTSSRQCGIARLADSNKGAGFGIETAILLEIRCDRFRDNDEVGLQKSVRMPRRRQIECARADLRTQFRGGYFT